MQDLDSNTQIGQAIAAVGRIDAVPSILKVLCQTTGMGFAAVARVTDGHWTCCAVQDEISFGLGVGGELDVQTTLCREVREARTPIAFDRASTDAVYCGHPTPKMYSFESYISVPIVLPDGDYFGNLCAIDPRPAEVANEKILSIFKHMAQLIALELDTQRRIETFKRELFDEKADAMLREQFIAVLGHDLRNPLSAISACANLLTVLKQLDVERVRALGERIGTSVKRMTRLIEDLLDLARGRLGGGLALNATPLMDLPRAIQEVVDELQTAHPDRSISVTLEINRPVPGDGVRLQQLVSNLLGNALVHGAKDSPVELAATTAGGQLVISVHNQGEPIPAERLAHIFEAYYRQDGRSGRRDGLGLGLYICQQIAKAHGGELSVASTQNLGTTFTATIPLTLSQPARSA